MALGSANTSPDWCVCLVQDGDRRELVLVAPGAPLRGWRVWQAVDETEAQVVWFSVSDADPSGFRSPTAGSPVGMRRHAYETAERFRQRMAGRVVASSAE